MILYQRVNDPNNRMWRREANYKFLLTTDEYEEPNEVQLKLILEDLNV